MLVRTATGTWIEKVAITGVEPGHKFPIVWVESESWGRPVPWPAEDVKLADA